MTSTVSHSAAEARRKMAHGRAAADRGAVASFSPNGQDQPELNAGRELTESLQMCFHQQL
jgi:hypothetical protein